MRSRTVAGAVLLASGLMGVAVNAAHADTDVPYDATSWGRSTQQGTSDGTTSTSDSEFQGGTATSFGQQFTNSGSLGTNYANQAATSNAVGGSQTQYNPAVSTPAYESSFIPSGSDQSSTVGGTASTFSDSANSGSGVVGGFTTHGVVGLSCASRQSIRSQRTSQGRRPVSRSRM